MGEAEGGKIQDVMDEPGMELVFNEEELPEKKTVSFDAKAPSQQEPKAGKKPHRPITKESIVDLQNLKDSENPEKLEYKYDIFESIILYFLFN